MEGDGDDTGDDTGDVPVSDGPDTTGGVCDAGVTVDADPGDTGMVSRPMRMSSMDTPALLLFAEPDPVSPVADSPTAGDAPRRLPSPRECASPPTSACTWSVNALSTGGP